VMLEGQPSLRAINVTTRGLPAPTEAPVHCGAFIEPKNRRSPP
jgi:hypothetical protein